VLVITLGTIAPRISTVASEAVHEFLDVQCRPGPALDRPQYAFNKDRRQYHATSILRRLSTLRPRDGQVVGILDVDLFLPDTPYVIGDADRDAGAAIFSLHRLAHANPDEVRRRARAESVHAAGHLLGLSHCTDYRCAMFYSRDAADVDRKKPGLCGSCRAALGLPAK
jgi:archaemetzincin